MARLASKYYLLIAGVAIGIVYGLVTRIVWGQQMALATLTYLFVIPTVLGIIPLIFSSEAQVRSYLFCIFVPWLTILSALLTLVLVHLEGVICLAILGAPFFILGTVGALVYRLIRIHINNKKNLLPSIALILTPALLAPVENLIISPSDVYSDSSEIVINSPAERVWQNIIRVAPIQDREYRTGFFNYLGVPRPVEAELFGEGPGALRKGHFEGGLLFVEHIREWQPGRRVSFDIEVDPNTVADRVFDQHVLKGNYFRFIDAAYDIEPISDTQVRLRLTSRYRLTSKVNFYGKLWGDIFLRDFQDRLLEVIKERTDQ
ncbi:MAG: hypothetical protein JO053_09115 [Acidobacteria bacterium]|nr:hypothetical protein [Acidobacteriota bacterium]